MRPSIMVRTDRSWSSSGTRRYLKAPRDDVGEHEAIMRATLSSNCAEAARLLKAHIQLATPIILSETAVQTSPSDQGTL